MIGVDSTTAGMSWSSRAFQQGIHTSFVDDCSVHVAVFCIKVTLL